MKIIMIPQLYNMFRETDNNTILRKRNLRKFIRENNVKYHIVGTQFVVDFDDFMKKINQKNINKQYNIPKLRNIASAVNEFNNNHIQKINHHLIRKIIEDKKVTYIKMDRQYLLNYEELEIQILKYLNKQKTKRKKLVVINNRVYKI